MMFVAALKSFCIAITIILSTTQCSSQSVCLTKSCEKEATLMLSKIDDSVEICEDFFDFSCGKYKPEIPSHKTKIDELDLILDSLQEQLNEAMSTEIDADEIEPFRKLKMFYQNCMDKKMIEQLGLKPIEDVLNSLGGWPVMSANWNEDTWSWQKTVKDLETKGFASNFIFELGLGADQKNSSKRTWMLDQPSLGVSREYLIKGLSDKIVEAYHSYQIDTAVICGADRVAAEMEMKEALDFEIALAKLSLAREDRRNRTKLYNPRSIEEFQIIFPRLDWLEYFNTFLTQKDQITGDEVIILSDEATFVMLHKLLESTPKRTIANYLMWRATQSSADYLNEVLRTRSLQYSKTQSGKQEYGPRWKECVAMSSRHLPVATGALYVRTYFSESSKQAASEMVDNIRDEFENILKSVYWMDDTTRAAALKKAEKIQNHIGYPNELMDDKKLIDYHKNLIIDEHEYLKSVLRLNQFRLESETKKFRESVNKTEWDYHASVAIANAYYAWLENSILIPAGILQGAFFNAERPRYMNYASIGYVIGHEITHGFDDQGRQYDADGNLSEWWEEDTKAAYLEKARCIIEQYGNYTEPTVKLNLNGINTQGENIADNGGVIVAYRAYQKWVKRNGEESKLPGLNFSPNQLFWISLAQTWCSVFREEDIKSRITTGVHSIARFRIIGPLSNTKEFSDDFQCPEGSNMNPVEKCKVW